MRQRLWQAVVITVGLYLLLSFQQQHTTVQSRELEVRVSDIISRIFP